MRKRGHRAILAVLVIGGGAVLALTARRRTRAVQQTLDVTRAGDLDGRVASGDGRPRFDGLAAASNAAPDRSTADFRDDAKHIVHELRRPLARLRARLAALERRSDGLPHAGEVTTLVAEADHILDLFGSLTRLWEVERGARRARFVTVDLAAVVREVADMLGSVAEDAGDHLSESAPATAPVLGDLNLLRQMLVNLVENAIRHTPPGTAITVAMVHATDEVRLVVSDDGPGIPIDQHERVIRRFGRLDAAREGQGLGLTLVDAIVRLHDGALRLEDAVPGLRVVIALPIAP